MVINTFLAPYGKGCRCQVTRRDIAETCSSWEQAFLLDRQILFSESSVIVLLSCMGLFRGV